MTSLQLVSKDLLNWLSSIHKPETIITCKRCNDICALVKVRTDDRLLIRISCHCGQLFSPPDSLPLSVRKSLLTLTPLSLMTALRRPYTDGHLPNVYAQDKVVKYLSIPK